MRVYLAGSLTGSDPEKALTWRSSAAAALKKKGIIAYSPTRGKQFDPKRKIEVDAEQHMPGPESTPKAINLRDYLDCVKADAVLAYLDMSTDWPSLGTVMELAWAWDKRIPTVVCVPADSFYMRHPMVQEVISHRVDSVEEGVQVVMSILLP